MKVKKLLDRPEHLQQKQHSTTPDTDQDSDDEVDINLSPSTPAPIAAPDRQQPNQEGGDGDHRNLDNGLVGLNLDDQVQEQGEEGTDLRRSGRQVRRPTVTTHPTLTNHRYQNPS